MRKLSRRQKLAIALSIFFGIIAIFVAFGLDGSHTVMPKKNMIFGIATLLSFKPIETYAGIWIMLFFLILYIVLFTVFICYLQNFLIKKEIALLSGKAFLYYGASFAIFFFLAFGLGTLFQIPNNGMLLYGTTLSFVFQVIFFSLIVFVVLIALVYAIVFAIMYLLPTSKDIEEEKDKLDEEEENKEEEEENKGDLSTSFDGVNASSDANALISGANASINATSSSQLVLADKKEVFPSLVAIDEEGYTSTSLNLDSQDVTLENLVNNLQVYLAKKHKLYYEISELAYFVSAFSASKLIILEGISGTGKSSLPRFFAEYIGEEAFFEPIQVTYKEKSDLLGYYNDFTGKYKETPFLKRLYGASYNQDSLNIMVLDEMNISRVEYYFADFLSVMEFPEDQREINLLTLPSSYDAPLHLKDGNLDLSPNTYFVGTCNKDDSTFTVTDKVIDRAIVINFNNYQKELSFDKDVDPIRLSYEGLNNLFKDADTKFSFSKEEREKFLSLIEFMSTEFDISIGNRIINQCDKMVPVYTAMNRDFKECLDIIFATKVLRKCEGRFDSSLKASLKLLKNKIKELYSDSFKETNALIDKLIRRSL